MIQEVVVNGAVEDDDSYVIVGLESVNDFVELPDHFRAHDVDRRVVDRDTPIRGRPPGQTNLFCWCIHSCHYFSFVAGSLNVSDEFITAAPAVLTTSSCESVPPEQPTAPI